MSSGGRPEGEFFLADKTSPSIVNSIQAHIIFNVEVWKERKFRLEHVKLKLVWF